MRGATNNDHLSIMPSQPRSSLAGGRGNAGLGGGSKRTVRVSVAGPPTWFSQESSNARAWGQSAIQELSGSTRSSKSGKSTGTVRPSQLSPMQEESSRLEWMKQKCRALSDNWKFNVLTTTLTIYALFGDDFRLAATHKQMDIMFNILTIIACIVFTMEIIVSSLGQAEYFMGFFFALDVGSTATLLFDLTWIGNALFCASDDDSGALRTSRAGRAGARAGRTVRIIRLMRLVKLYKAYKTNLEAKKAVEAARLKAEAEAPPHGSDIRRLSSFLAPGDDVDEDWPQIYESQEDSEGGDSRATLTHAPSMNQDDSWADEAGTVRPSQMIAEPEKPEPSQSRVGKKLSDMTTRRVIILVLVMLIVMPQFTPSSSGWEEFLYSSNFGSDVVYERWRSYCGGNRTEAVGASSKFGAPLWCLQDLDSHVDDRRKSLRSWFERALLNFMYQHHHGSFSYRLFWVGVNSTTMTEPHDAGLASRTEEAEGYLGKFMQLNQEKNLGKYVYPTSMWTSRFTGSGDWDDNVVPISEVVIERTQKEWKERCSGHVGIPVQPAVQALAANDCSTTEELRCSEREFATAMGLSLVEGKDFSILFIFDTRGTTKLEAGLNILQTIFICLAVGVGAMSFSKDANELLLHPIERMIAKMETIKDNPLEAMRLGDLEYRREEVEQARKKDALAKMSRLKRLLFQYQYMKVVKEPMETVLLEKTIIKLGGLLALGFGEAGAEIVGRFAGTSPGAGIRENALGTLVDCAFGFAALRNFTESMDALKERTMLFVNQVSEIVHGCTDDWHGAPSKNLGDAFMLVWRLTGTTPERQTKLADMSVMAFAKIVAEINKSRVLAVYRAHPGLLQRMENFRVTMGFGLHIGWAVEGAIGSEYKIDAAYLSPCVHVASRLQMCSLHYGVSMALSDTAVSYCSKELAMQCRLIDHVTVKGSRTPIRLYTVDLDPSELEVVLRMPEPVSRNRFKIRQLREIRKNEKWNEDVFIPDLFTSDDDLAAMRRRYSKEFFHRFSMGYRNYEAGEWLAARDMFFTCHYQPKPDVGRDPVSSEDQWPEDGPSRILLRYMKSFNYEPPQDWPGHRELPLAPAPR
mmetsp:Transcript_77613/g.251291  ORF Transcript_77613/g.251291 Transcript_77613/m.251291 type:complete len:1086 (-) Transcript_77613:120-3377(-)